MNPKVSFVVPCYKLAHLLPECVQSILSQTFQDFEILIMDDHSPDNTPEVANSFTDPRIKHVRNDPNLGHLRNYNKGIAMARGQYIWLISADDCLRRPYLLEKYVAFMESHPTAGFIFCPGIGLEDGQETGVLHYSVHGDSDALYKSDDFFIKLLNSNSVLAASGMVRKDVYEKLGMFPLNMPFAGDWYLWLLFALHYDIGYLAEPMVLYRQHGQSMTNILNEDDPRTCTRDDLTVLWEIKREAEKANRPALVKRVDDSLVDRACLFLSSQRTQEAKPWFTIEDLENSVEVNCPNVQERRQIRSRVYAGVADGFFWKRDFSAASQFYRRSLKLNPWQPKVLLQSLLLSMGGPGVRIREAQFALRQKFSASKSH